MIFNHINNIYAVTLLSNVYFVVLMFNPFQATVFIITVFKPNKLYFNNREEGADLYLR